MTVMRTRSTEVNTETVRKWVETEQCTATSLLDLYNDDPQAFGKVYKHHTGFSMSKSGEVLFVRALRQLAKEQESK